VLYEQSGFQLHMKRVSGRSKKVKGWEYEARLCAKMSIPARAVVGHCHHWNEQKIRRLFNQSVCAGDGIVSVVVEASL